MEKTKEDKGEVKPTKQKDKLGLRQRKSTDYPSNYKAPLLCWDVFAFRMDDFGEEDNNFPRTKKNR